MGRRTVFRARTVWIAAILALMVTMLSATSEPNAPVLAPPDRGLRVFHIGHSLVGRDMPMMLEQLAHAAGFTEHRHESQLGWGTPLRAHWYPDTEIAGFESENDHARFRPAREAIASGEYDAVILTEMVELRDAIRYHNSARYFARWIDAARQGRPDVRVYLYKTWHDLEHPEGWLPRLDRDPEDLWQGRLLEPAWSDPALGPVHVVPAAQVLAALTRALAEGQGAPGLRRVQDLFRSNPDGTLDTIHLNPQGDYLIALTHFATLYHRSPEGLPHALLRANGTATDSPGPEAAALMQRVVWQVVRATPHTGLDPDPSR